VAGDRYDVAVVGAGPYGLSTAAHLRGKGLSVAVFGRPLQLWREHMPEGMLLRSHWWATNLSDPDGKWGFEQYFATTKQRACYPLPIRTFIEYGMWFQRNAVPEVDPTFVSTIDPNGAGFVLTLENGRVVSAQTVVMAVGVRPYAHIPPEYSRISRELVSHSFDHASFARFARKTVAVIGGGQSAVEYAALLAEAGATVHLIARRHIHWLGPDPDAERDWIDQIRAPRAGIAPGWIPWTLERFPYLFQRLPQSHKDRFISSNYGAAASDWLRGRVTGKVQLHEPCAVGNLESGTDGGVELALSDGTSLRADHVLLCTGYRVSIDRLSILSQTLRARVHTDAGVPVLDPWFETSVSGLYLVGLSSVRSFGPLYRFVVGAKAAAPRVAAAVARQVRSSYGRVR
jgi:thioredoxin reductase